MLFPTAKTSYCPFVSQPRPFSGCHPIPFYGTHIGVFSQPVPFFLTYIRISYIRNIKFFRVSAQRIAGLGQIRSAGRLVLFRAVTRIPFYATFIGVISQPPNGGNITSWVWSLRSESNRLNAEV